MSIPKYELTWSLAGTVDDTIAVGDSPIGIFFDDTYIWVTKAFNDTVSKITD
ncbi:hypothetical protein ACFLTJ_01460 [Chloroflexota bacterium]